MNDPKPIRESSQGTHILRSFWKVALARTARSIGTARARKARSSRSRDMDRAEIHSANRTSRSSARPTEARRKPQRKAAPKGALLIMQINQDLG